MHWRYVTINFIYIFFHTIQKRYWNLWTLSRLIETNGLKLLHNVKTHWILIFNSLKRVRGVHVTCCKYVHGCTKEQASLGEFGSSMWVPVGFRFAMHPSNVGSSAHFDYVC
jgi:hypothetical protein